MSKNKKQKRTLNALNLEMEDICPLTSPQLDAYESDKHLLLYGVAGTGKTYLALYLGYLAIQERQQTKVVVVRSTVPSRDQGFLPGDERQKAAVYEAPYSAITNEIFGRGDAYHGVLKHHGLVEFMTTSYIRGVTITDSVVIIDEFQNLSFHELDSIITRIGKNCRVIFCGDVTQSDLDKDVDKRGVKNFMGILDKMRSFERVNFGVDDIVRSGFVRDYIIKKTELGL